MDITLKLPADDLTIAWEIKRFEELIQIRKTEIKVLQAAIKHYQSQCIHPGQKTGWNERDGNWANPCKVCGYSY